MIRSTSASESDDASCSPRLKQAAHTHHSGSQVPKERRKIDSKSGGEDNRNRRIRGSTSSSQRLLSSEVQLVSDGDVTSSSPEDKRKKSSSIMSLLIANRSAVFFNMRRFEDSLLDMNDSLSFGYNILSSHNLITRKILSLRFLGRDKEAQDTYEKMLGLIEASSDIINERKKMMWIEKLSSAFNQPIDQLTNLRLIYREEKQVLGSNLKLPGASSFLQMSYQRTKGRLLKVNKNIKKGDILIVDKPIASILAAKFHDDYCNHCMINLHHRFVPCLTCDDVRYCSIQCQEESYESYHKIECQYYKSLILYPNGLHVLRILLSFGFNECLKQSIEWDDSNHPMIPLEAWPTIGFPKSFSSFYSLLPKDLDSIEFKYCYPMAAALYAIITFKSLKLIDEYHLVYFGSHVMIDSLLKISRNADTIFTSDFSLIIGSGIHLTSSLFNHDCDPNVETTYVGSKAIHSAKRDISLNDELCVSYGVNYAFDHLNDRKEFLFKSFMFECFCSRCLVEEYKVRDCPKCSKELKRTKYGTIACVDCDVSEDSYLSIESFYDDKSYLSNLTNNCSLM